MILDFDKEGIQLGGCLVFGTVSVQDYGDGLDAVAFKPEKPVVGLRWSEVELPCDDWLTSNRPRVQRRFNRRGKW